MIGLDILGAGPPYGDAANIMEAKRRAARIAPAAAQPTGPHFAAAERAMADRLGGANAEALAIARMAARGAIGAAAGMPAFAMLQPYFLTDYPKSGADLAALYDGYLRAYDGLVANVYSLWHPVSTGAVVTALAAARKIIETQWAQGGAAAIMAVQMLAGLMGWFNANYVNADGSVNWAALNTPVNAAVIEGAHEAAQATVAAAQAAGKAVGDNLKAAVSITWWTTVALVVGGLAVVGLLGWALLRSDAGRAAAAQYLPGRR